MSEEKKCPKCQGELALSGDGTSYRHLRNEKCLLLFGEEEVIYCLERQLAQRDKELAQLTKERDDWKAATGLGSMTAEEAGDKIDAQDKELADEREENERLREIATGLIERKYKIEYGWSGKGKENGYYLNDKYVGTTRSDIIDVLLAEAGKENKP